MFRCASHDRCQPLFGSPLDPVIVATKHGCPHSVPAIREPLYKEKECSVPAIAGRTFYLLTSTFSHSTYHLARLPCCCPCPTMHKARATRASTTAIERESKRARYVTVCVCITRPNTSRTDNGVGALTERPVISDSDEHLSTMSEASASGDEDIPISTLLASDPTSDASPTLSAVLSRTEDDELVPQLGSPVAGSSATASSADVDDDVGFVGASAPSSASAAVSTADAGGDDAAAVAITPKGTGLTGGGFPGWVSNSVRK